MSRTLKWILAANLMVLAILAFVYPHLMVGPGKLIPGHAKLEADCLPVTPLSPVPNQNAASAVTSRRRSESSPRQVCQFRNP